MAVSTSERLSHVTDIILIGPICAGKSTIASLLAESLALPRVGLDEVFWSYCEEQQFGHADFMQTMQEHGVLKAIRRLEQCFPSAVERLLSDYPRSVIDLGAGHTHYDDPALFEHVRQLLSPYKHVILLLPSPDLDESVRILKERCWTQRKQDWVIEGYDFIEHWVKDRCNAELATLTVYTDDRTPQQTHDEILQRLSY